MPELFLLALVQVVLLGMWGDMSSWASSSCASASLLGQGFFSSIQPGFLAVTHTSNFLLWM